MPPPRPPPPPPAMPPPPSASSSAIATRFATHWITDAFSSDESLQFSVLQALLRSSSDPLAGAPEATRERVAFRSLQEVSSLVPAGGDAAATAGVLRVDGARSGEDVLFRLIREVEISGKLEKDLLPPFSQDIQETIRAKKSALPETCFQLLKGVDPWITSTTPPSQLDHNGTEQCDNDRTMRSRHECVNIEKPVFPTDNAEVQQDTMANVVNESETANLQKDPSAPTFVLHQPCTPESRHRVPPQEGTTDAVGFGARSTERSPIVEGNMSVGSVHSKLATNLQPGTATEDSMAFEGQNADKSRVEVNGANKGNQALHDDGSIMKNNTAHGELTAQTAPVSQNCNVTLHGKTSEANCLPEQKNEKNRTDVQKDNCCNSMPSSSKDRDRESAKKASNEEKSEDTSPEIHVRSKDQDIGDILKNLCHLFQQGFCIKCGKDGDLLECSSCLLSAHESCLGSSVTFDETNLFYCPICICRKAKEAYCEAMKNVVAFFGTAQVRKQHDEQLNRFQPGAANRDGHSNGCDTSKRNSIHQNEAYDLAHREEEPHQPRKKQKINARGNGYPKVVISEKVPFENFGPASMNKHSVLQNNSKTRVEHPEKKQQEGDKEACNEAGNDNSSHKRSASSQRRCDPPAHQDGETDQEDSLTASNQTGGSDELEATSSIDPGKRPSPPWRNIRHSKKRLHEKESAVPSKSRKGIARQDQHMPTSTRKRSSVHPQKRYSNPIAPPGRRNKLAWTKEEEAVLREAMAKFAPQGSAQIPWTRILEYGRHGFHKTRLPSDLRSKWRNMIKKPDADSFT